MAWMTVKVKNDHTSEVSAAFQTALQTALEEIGLVAEGYGKKLCPVDTGRLRGSITHGVIKDEKCAYIGTNVYYGKYVEMGTSRMKAQPYIRPAVLNHRDEYKSILKTRLEHA